MTLLAPVETSQLTNLQRLEMSEAMLNQIMMLAARPDVYPTADELIYNLAKEAFQHIAVILAHMDAAKI